MKYVATIRLLTARPMKGAPLRMGPVEAPNPVAAARIVAMKAAKHLYGDNGQPGFFTTDADGAVQIFIGEYLGNGVTVGCTALIRVQPVE